MVQQQQLLPNLLRAQLCSSSSSSGATAKALPQTSSITKHAGSWRLLRQLLLMLPTPARR
jgi:hypothetical protein